MPWGERWANGDVWIAKDGTKTYYGRVSGRMVSLRKHDEEAALAELIRRNIGAGEPVPPLNERWIEEYLADCRNRKLDPGSIRTKRLQLNEWRERVGYQRTSIQTLNAITKKLTGARNKVAALKAYFTWLRQQGRVRRMDDPTLDLKKPSAPECDWDRVVPRETLERVLPLLTERWADLLTILMATGWHVTELNRFARSGKIDGDVLVCPRHKSGEPHRTRVSDTVLEAGRRTRSRGAFSPAALYGEIGRACARAGVERFGPGSLRHTVATNAVRSGATPEAVANFLGHKGAYMVRAIYAKVAVPQKVPTLA